MHQEIFKEAQLPWAELRQLGLVKEGKLLISEKDKRALLSGRRTSMQQLKDIGGENLHIAAIDVKLSLRKTGDGDIQLQAHPIHKYPIRPEALEEIEAVQLVSGSNEVLHKNLADQEGNIREVFFEYDAETREFILTDPFKITVPDQVNGEKLTPAQREHYRRGKEVELSEGTRFRYTGVDADPVRSNRLLLVTSILIDGGITYLAYEGLKAMRGNHNHDPEASYQSEGYQNARAEMEKQHKSVSKDQKTDSGETRGYTRSGHSR